MRSTNWSAPAGRNNTAAAWVSGAVSLFGLVLFILFITGNLFEHPGGYLLAALPLLVFLCGLAGVFLIRAGKPARGAWVVLAAGWLMALGLSFGFAGLAPAAGTYVLVTSLMLVYAGLPAGRQRAAGLLMVAVVILIVLVELLNPGFRVSSPGLAEPANLFAAALWVVFLAHMLVQARTRTMPVEGRVGAGFLMIIFLAAMVIVSAVQALGDYAAAARNLADINGQVQATVELQSALWRMKEAETTVILNPSLASLENEFMLYRSELEEALAAWKAAVPPDEGSLSGLALHLDADVQALVLAAGESVRLARDGQVEEARRAEIDSTNPLARSLENRLDILVSQMADVRAQAQSEVDAVMAARMARTAAVGAFALAAGGLLSLLVWYSIAGPLAGLVDAAQALSRGNRTVRAPEAADEFGLLAATLNDTAGQLDRLYSNLELQVTDRSRALELSAEINRRLSTILDMDQLVREVVEQLRQAFAFYHVQIYLYDEARESLVLAAGSGDAGREMMARGSSVLPGRGLVGRAAESSQVLLAVNTGADPAWAPNPLLPNTRSELAVPLAVGDAVLGVLDVQQDVMDGISPEDAGLVQSIANQAAIAIQNARAYARAARQAQHEALAAEVGKKVQQAADIDEVLQVAVRELGQALGASRASVQLSREDLSISGESKPSRPQARSL